MVDVGGGGGEKLMGFYQEIKWERLIFEIWEKIHKMEK